MREDFRSDPRLSFIVGFEFIVLQWKVFFFLSFSISTTIRQPYLVQVSERIKPRPNAEETENVVSDSKVLAARTRNLTAASG